MLVSLITIVVAVYGGLCLCLYFYQARLVYFPSTALHATPQSLGLAYENVQLPSGAQTSVHGWYIPSEHATLTVLFCHGNGGNISDRPQTIELLHNLGVNVLIFDYAGYGESRGSPSEAQTYQDALTAWNYLTQERKLTPKSIVVFGRSLGSGIASWLAAEVKPAGLVMEAAFTSVPDVGAKRYPLFPIQWLARIRYDSASRMKTLNIPTLFAHSVDDETIPFEHGRTLYRLASEPKTFLEMTGSHNDAFLQTGERYAEALSNFFHSVGT